MSSVSSAAATQVAITQAQIQTEMAAHLMKVAQQVGRPAQVLELVEQTVESAVQIAAAAAGQMDMYA
jgi:hypothetical protein